MLLSNRDGVSVRMGRKGMRGMGDARTGERRRARAAHGVPRRAAPEGGYRHGRIRQGSVPRWPMMADCSRGQSGKHHGGRMRLKKPSSRSVCASRAIVGALQDAW
jgi:hypothetical protein